MNTQVHYTFVTKDGKPPDGSFHSPLRSTFERLASRQGFKTTQSGCLSSRSSSALYLSYDPPSANNTRPFCPRVALSPQPGAGDRYRSIDHILPWSIEGQAFLHIEPCELLMLLAHEADPTLQLMAVVEGAEFPVSVYKDAYPLHALAFFQRVFADDPSFKHVQRNCARPLRQPTVGACLKTGLHETERENLLRALARTPFAGDRTQVSVASVLYGYMMYIVKKFVDDDAFSRISLILPDGILFRDALDDSLRGVAATVLGVNGRFGWYHWSEMKTVIVAEARANLMRRQPPPPLPSIPETPAARAPTPLLFEDTPAEEEEDDTVVWRQLPPRNVHNAVHRSLVPAPLDVWLVEYTDAARVKSALTWRLLHPSDAAILTLFDKADGKQSVNYVVAEDSDDGEAETPKNKRAKKGSRKKRKEPRGLFDLSPGIRWFVMQPGTVCIDAKALVNGITQFHLDNGNAAQGSPHTKAHMRHFIGCVYRAMIDFYQQAADHGSLPSNVRLVSVVPEGLLVRGFLARDPRDTFAACQSYVAEKTDGFQPDLMVVDLTPSSQAEHPLSGDFALYNPVSLDDFELTPAHHAVFRLLDAPAHVRAIDWLYESRGNWGKTFVSRFYAERRACCIKAELAQHVNLAVTNHLELFGYLHLLIIDMPREMATLDSQFAGVVENLKNGLIFNSKYQSRAVQFNVPKIVIFANEPPPASVSYALSADRLRVVNLRETPVRDGLFCISSREYPGVVTDSRYIST